MEKPFVAIETKSVCLNSITHLVSDSTNIKMLQKKIAVIIIEGLVINDGSPAHWFFFSHFQQMF